MARLWEAISGLPSDIWGISKATSQLKTYDISKKQVTGKTGDVFQAVPVGLVGTGGTLRTAWSGLGTTGKVGVGILGGAGGYAAYDWLFGGKKQPTSPQKQEQQQQQNQAPIITPVINQTPVIVQPSITNTYQNDYSSNDVNIYGNENTVGYESKKQMSSTPTASWNTPFSATQPLEVVLRQEGTQKQSAEQSQGTDFTTIAVIAAVGLIAYGYVSKGGKKHAK